MAYQNSTKNRNINMKNSISETKKTTAQIEDILIKSRVSMLINAAFFGKLASRLRLIDATKWCPTAATDGRNLYYNRNFVDALNHGEQIFLVGHEVLHCVYDHMDKTRLGDRDPRLANIAQDFVINADLIEAKIGEPIKLVNICYDPKYRGKFWEEIYDLLIDDAKQNGNSKDLNTLDMHLEDDKASDGDDDDNNDGTNRPIKYSEEERKQIKEEFQNAVIQTARAVGAGNLPSGVRRLVDQLLNPQLDWRELLAMQIQSVVKSDYTWLRPSRKGLDAGLYLPGMDREQTVDVCIAIDTSGSICSDMLRDFLSEIKGIMDQYNDFTIRMWCFDTAVHNPIKITSETSSDLLCYNIEGGGGTDFDVNFNYMKDNNIVPKKFIMFTDGYPWGSWGDENYCDTLFIVHGNIEDKSPTAPFGITVPYSREDKR
jgi:predicted metal-dependent peptidase